MTCNLSTMKTPTFGASLPRKGLVRAGALALAALATAGTLSSCGAKVDSGDTLQLGTVSITKSDLNNLATKAPLVQVRRDGKPTPPDSRMTCRDDYPFLAGKVLGKTPEGNPRKLEVETYDRFYGGLKDYGQDDVDLKGHVKQTTILSQITPQPGQASGRIKNWLSNLVMFNSDNPVFPPTYGSAGSIGMKGSVPEASYKFGMFDSAGKEYMLATPLDEEKVKDQRKLFNTSIDSQTAEILGEAGRTLIKRVQELPLCNKPSQ